MPTLDTLWTCVGITKHVGAGKEVVKVRFGLDLIRRIKSSKSAINIRTRGERLTEVRSDFVNLPTPMLKMDALRYALAAPEFQSPEDQALIQEQIDNRMPKTPRQPRAKKEKVAKVRATKKQAPSLDSIKTRARKAEVTAEQVLAAVQTPDPAV